MESDERAERIHVWNDFINKYNKSYVDQQDENVHYERFLANLGWIESVSPTFDSFTVGITFFSDWLEEEIRNRFIGVEYDNEAIEGESFEGVNRRESLLPSIDWSTTNNPLGRSITTRVKNQNACGACWAFTAAESAESSVAMNTGIVESLSVQQLIDCDVNWDKGCIGGNPVSAYPYIMRHGLAAETSYPYRQKQGTCYDNRVRAVSGITGFRRLRPFDEENMAFALYKTPIAVGLAGTARSFLMYRGGIYNHDDCGTDLNHAALLVGYGTTYRGEHYWVLKNSWGPFWGERGYMRLKRGVGLGQGLCGIAKAPTFAIGGFGGNISDAALKKTDSNLPWLPISIRIETAFLYVAAVYFSLIAVAQLKAYWFPPRRRSSFRDMELAYITTVDPPQHTYGSVNAATRLYTPQPVAPTNI